MTDLALAVTHHLLAFALAAILAAEAAIVRPGMAAGDLQRAGLLDAAYGAAAGLVLAVGIGRVFLGPKSADFYLSNPFFWAKISAFATVALLSVQPTVRVIAWRRKAKRDLSFVPVEAEIRAVRRFFAAEAVAFALIPAFAAAIALGFGM